MSDRTALFELNPPEIPDSSTCKQSLQVAATAPERSLLIATGVFHRISSWTEPLPAKRNGGSFENCTIRPVPVEYHTNGVRLFEVLAMGASRGGQFLVTTAELLTEAKLIWTEETT